MRRVLTALAVALALTASPASAFDIKAFSERLTDCDGPGLKLASFLAAEPGTAETESQGYAVLEIVEMVLGDDIAPGALQAAARTRVDGIRDLATAKADAMIEKCGFVPAAPASGGIDNPFVAE